MTLNLYLAEKLGGTFGNVYALQQVLSNLVTNAVQALREYRENGEVAITTMALPRGSVRLIVSDNGPGILPEHKGRLLEPFFTTKKVGREPASASRSVTVSCALTTRRWRYSPSSAGRHVSDGFPSAYGC